MDNKKSGLALLAEQIPAIKAYKQVAWNINQLKKKNVSLPGTDIIAQCITSLEVDYGKNFMKKWRIDLLAYEKPYCLDRYFVMSSIPDKHNDKKPEVLQLLVGSTQPNLNILLELDSTAQRACWLYYDALKEAPFQHAMNAILQFFLDKKIQHLNLLHVHQRVNVPLIRSFFRKNNYTIDIEQPAVAVQIPVIQQPSEKTNN
ncbi:hypothetical protein [Paraflavitalea pollutisoli]|uniref:hypothetical protein n=1 Tax=Paraflavitalea pollutisoli TaxID=3034143 RepID=UPI0023EAFBC1|nr:hypothetical protein [Paraflavitalea sp. H1-2-19X]